MEAKELHQLNGWQLTLGDLSPPSARQFVDALRTIKTTDAHFIAIDLTPDEPVIGASVQAALDICKAGQRLARYLERSILPTVAIVSTQIGPQKSELALACSHIFIGPHGGLNPPRGTADDMPIFGTLNRLEAVAGFGASKLLEDQASWQNAVSQLEHSRNVKMFNDEAELEALLAAVRDAVDQTGLMQRRLIAASELQSPETIPPADYLEASLLCSRMANDRFQSNVSFERTAWFGSSSGPTLDKSDDYNDHLKLSAYPDDEIKALERKSRLQEVALLLKQRKAPIRGRVIELGSGYGYFSALASRSPDVASVTGLDISTTELVHIGPLMWERLKPDWKKFNIRIADMNRLHGSEGLYDTVVFCASLHHSSDVAKSLAQANALLRYKGSLIIHGEHYLPRFGHKKPSARTPQTIGQFKKALRAAGFKPKVFRYALSGGRHTWLRKMVFTVPPLCWINGLWRFHSFMILGVKREERAKGMFASLETVPAE